MSDHEDFVRRLEETSSLYAERTTRLSRLLSRIEAILSELPGKMEAEVSNERGDILRFHREHQRWELVYLTLDENGDQRYFSVTDSSVWVKSQAACLVPALIDKITSHQSQQLESVEKGLSSLESIPWIDADAEVEIAKEEEKARATQSDDGVPF